MGGTDLPGREDGSLCVWAVTLRDTVSNTMMFKFCMPHDDCKGRVQKNRASLSGPE